MEADLVYFFVDDMDRAIDFYRDVIGLELAFRSGNDWAQLAAGSVQLGLHSSAHGARRAGGTLAFTVDDLDTTRAGLVARGVEIGHEGGGQSGGPRFVEFEDPDGNVLAVFERSPA